jgi:lipopolysaccharide/colanic/teichoic acid biosynthesis glycosyltransferase
MIDMKRVLDCGLSIVLLLVLAPFFLVVSLLVALDGGNVFYGHPRIGWDGRQFRCLKFRTMIVDANDCLIEYLGLHPAAALEWQLNQKLDVDPRITPIGNFLRRTSLDELPQLFNVLKGEMSLVGPRPVTKSELARYGEHAIDYLTCRPGITGLWQVSGRNRLSYDRRVALDVEYSKEQSLWGDLVILLRTFRVLLTGDGK